MFFKYVSSVIFQTVQHGFPHKPSALAWDPKLKLLAIGTKTGTIKMYPLARYQVISAIFSLLIFYYYWRNLMHFIGCLTKIDNVRYLAQVKALMDSD